MVLRYCIEDELHAEMRSEHPTLQDAVLELERLARIPWDVDPNIAPCQSWRTCGRRYEIIEYDTSTEPWRSVRRVPALEVSAAGAVWDTRLSRA
jgi:hypothetical protein